MSACQLCASSKSCSDCKSGMCSPLSEEEGRGGAQKESSKSTRERDEDSEEVEQRAGGSDQVFVERFVSLSVCRSESGRQEAGDEGLQ